jgi:hypothetical protein
VDQSNVARMPAETETVRGSSRCCHMSLAGRQYLTRGIAFQLKLEP